MSNTKAYIMLVCASLFWSGNFIIGKFAFLTDIPPLSLVFYRWLLVWIILLPFTFKEIIMKLLNLIGKKRILLPMPLPVAEMTARIFEIMPKPLLTRDQLKLLKYDNIVSGKYKTNSDIGVPSVRYFDEEVKKYCYMWREGGQFSTEKYNSEKSSDVNLS